MNVILSVEEGKAYIQNADTNAYLENKFATIDVSGPIAEHNASGSAHSDIRALVSNAQSKADSAAAAASKAQSTADGKANASHNHAASTITAGTFSGQVNANATAVSNVGTAQVRNIYAGTSDMAAGSTALTTGDIYFVYE